VENHALLLAEKIRRDISTEHLFFNFFLDTGLIFQQSNTKIYYVL